MNYPDVDIDFANREQILACIDHVAAMIKDGAGLLPIDIWWPTVFPGLALCWAGISVAFIAEGLNRRLREVNVVRAGWRPAIFSPRPTPWQ